MRKRLYKNIGIIVVLVGIITLLIPSPATADFSYGITYDPEKIAGSDDIEVEGGTQMTGAYQTVQCETQLFYWNGSVWVNLSSAITTEHNKDRAWVSYFYHDVQQGFNTYQAKSYHYWYDPLKGTGSYVSVSPHQVVL